MHIDQVVRAISASSRDIENWIGRLELSTKFTAPGRGRPRVFTRENAIELGFIAALVRAGVEPSKANAYARSMLRYLQMDNLHEWLVFRAGDVQRAIATNTPDFSGALMQLATDEAAPTYSFVQLGEVVRRVDRAIQAGDAEV